jgi:hypothetical protein
MNPF